MWRFILPAFALLGLAFYELSGGADYAPVPGSLQAPLPDPEAGPAIAARDAPAEPADPGPRVRDFRIAELLVLQSVHTAQERGQCVSGAR